MTGNDQHPGLEGELTAALDDLHRGLQLAADATASIRALLPRVAALGSIFDGIEGVIRGGRQQLGVADGAGPIVYTRPTLVAPSPAARPSSPQPTPSARAYEPAESSARSEWSGVVPDVGTLDPSFEGATAQADAVDDSDDFLVASSPDFPRPAVGPGVTCFRLEFESRPGPLDLRIVDEAVGEHPAVRDVALLDYDGRKATLKVWIDGSATAADVQQSLLARASQIFAADNEVSIVAIEDAA